MASKTKHNLIRYNITAVFFIIIIFFYLFGMLKNFKTIKETVLSSVQKTVALEDSDTLDIVKSFISASDTAFTDNVFDKFTLININGLFNRILLKKSIYDVASSHTVYRLGNGQLTYYYPLFGVNIAHKNIKKLQEYLDSVGTELLYVQAPLKINKYNNQLPHGLKDYPNLNTDNFLLGLDKLNIDYIDLREVFHEEHFFYTDLFYNTDHHWKTETGFWVYTYLMDYINTHYGITYDRHFIDDENFTYVTLKDSFIGSLANRAGTWYAGIDDFTYIYPNFETNFTWNKYAGDMTLKLSRSGSFDETILFKERCINPRTALAYRDNCYFDGNPALVKITNNKVENGRILVVQDSFGKSVTSFLALSFHQVDVLDLRDFTKITLLDYLKQNTYDMVIILYSPSCFSSGLYYEQFKFYEYE